MNLFRAITIIIFLFTSSSYDLKEKDETSFSIENLNQIYSLIESLFDNSSYISYTSEFKFDREPFDEVDCGLNCRADISYLISSLSDISNKNILSYLGKLQHHLIKY
jgi:hypothetical protein